jgi:hypothetical protein
VWSPPCQNRLPRDTAMDPASPGVLGGFLGHMLKLALVLSNHYYANSKIELHDLGMVVHPCNPSTGGS